MKLIIWLLDWIQRSPLLGLLGVDAARRAGFKQRFLEPPLDRKECVWFHASSMGELEMIRPLIDDFTTRGEIVAVSVFSASARSGLEELRARTVFCGFSPGELRWAEAFRFFKVKKIVVSKYDLWPGLLFAASQLELPLVVINAEARFSFRVARRLFEWTRSALPRFFLFSSEESPPNDLIFKGAQTDRGVDPRWERLARRLDSNSSLMGAQKQADLSDWRSQISRLQSPRLILGSAWIEDLEKVLPCFAPDQGSLIVVPHSLAEINVNQMRQLLDAKVAGRYVLVNQMGLLAELYLNSDCAFVGGGFGNGIHSTLEPAMAGIPVACGPARARDFAEARELEKKGFLTICANTPEILNWLNTFGKNKMPRSYVDQKRAQYRALLEQCLRIR